MPGFKRRQAHLVSHYKWNDFSCHPISSNAALGRVSKVNIHNSLFSTHSLFSHERMPRRLFSDGLVFHLTNEKNCCLSCCICQQSPQFDIYYYQRNRKPSQATNKLKLLFLSSIQMHDDRRKCARNTLRYLETIPQCEWEENYCL